MQTVLDNDWVADCSHADPAVEVVGNLTNSAYGQDFQVHCERRDFSRFICDLPDNLIVKCIIILVYLLSIAFTHFLKHVD